MSAIRRHAAALATGLLLALFAVLAINAARQKSSTFDEPLDVYAAWNQRFQRDFTVIPEHPPLWTMLASLALDEHSLRPNGSHISPFTHLDVAQQDKVVFDALYRTPGVDAESLVQRCRVVMVSTGVVLGLLLAAWATRLAGSLAAFIAVSFLILDPSFLANAPLIKNDTFAATVFFALAFAVWSVGRKATTFNVIALALICGAACVVKFTDLPFVAVAIALIAGRAFVPSNWILRRHDATSTSSRLRVSMRVIVLVMTIGIAATWAAYRFQFHPSDAADTDFSTQRFVDDFRLRDLSVQHPDRPATDAEMAAWSPPLFVRAIEFAIDHKLMPSAWLHGLLFMRSHTLMRESYLLGKVSLFGTWWYFPFALLVKLPIGTLAAFAFACIASVMLWRVGHRPDLWTMLCIGVPSAVFVIATLASNLNIGIRHALPILPMAYLGVGVVAAKSIELWRPAGVIVAALILATAVETLHAAPDYLAFFNVAAGGSDGGINLLGDSNLDWGQDLPLLAKWQESHRDRPLYLSYFGFADPAAYGIQYRMMPGDYVHGRPPDAPERPAYAAISVTNLQGIYVTGPTRELYRRYRQSRPIAKLGGTIYVYELPP